MRGLHVNPTRVGPLSPGLLERVDEGLRSAGRRVRAGVRLMRAVSRRDVARAMIYIEQMRG